MLFYNQNHFPKRYIQIRDAITSYKCKMLLLFISSVFNNTRKVKVLSLPEVGQCKTCKFIDSSTTISAPKFVYHIKHHFTCTSSHLIYCISCSRCGMLYIGKTGRCLRTRFGEHRRSVTSNDANQPVARHFNNGSHCVSDMKIRALCPISGSNDSRKRHEMRLISKLGTVHPHGINEHFSYI